MGPIYLLLLALQLHVPHRRELMIQLNAPSALCSSVIPFRRVDSPFRAPQSLVPKSFPKRPSSSCQARKLGNAK